MNFQGWLVEKKVQDHQLLFTHSLKTEQEKALFSSLADQMAAFRPSQSLGLQFLELATDLILLKKDNLISRNFTQFEFWKEHLHQLRYPQTVHRDSELKHKIEQLSWPSNAKVKFERRGDRAGVELKIFISSSLDLKKAVADLERLEKEFPA